MKAMIMAAGIGTRLLPLTAKVPKPMVPVANKPLMEHIINLLKKHDFSDIVSNLYYLGDKIEDYFSDGSKFGINLTYSPEKELKGTAGGVKNNEDFLDKTFLVISGDALTDIDFTELLAFHQKQGALATIALKPMKEVSQYGVVVTDDNGVIKDFQEKPKPEVARSNLVNTGIYIFEPEIFNWIPENKVYDFGRQLFPLLAEKEAPFYGYKISDYWSDVGCLDAYHQANMDALTGKVKLETFEAISKKAAFGGEVKLKGGAVIGPGCHVEEGTSLNNVVIWPNTKIGKGAVLNDCVIGEWCNIGSDCVIGPKTVVGSECSIGDNAKIMDAVIAGK